MPSTSSRKPNIEHRKPEILIVAGEVSGDLLGAELMAELKKRHKNLHFAGVGGGAMRKQGLQSLSTIDDFHGMGLIEVVSSIPRLLKLRSKLVAYAIQHKPVLCITIDNQEFSRRLAAKLAPLGIPCVQYAAPKVWAWRQGRVHALKRIFKHILCVFPFEAEFFNKHKLPATYIGHPVVERMAKLPTAQPPLTPRLALLPGSRKNELTYHWPLFLQTYQRLKALHPKLTGIVAVESTQTLETIKAMGWDDSLTTATANQRFAALTKCTAALTKSGTNNLEIALLGLPAIVAYRMNKLTHAILKYVLRLHVPLISPPNLVLGKMAYPEFVQNAATPENLTRALHPLLSSAKERQQQLNQLKQVKAKLKTTQSPLKSAADVIDKFLEG